MERGYSNSHKDMTELYRQIKTSLIEMEKNMDGVTYLCSMKNMVKDFNLQIHSEFCEFSSYHKPSKTLYKDIYNHRLFNGDNYRWWRYDIPGISKREVNEEKAKYLKLLLKEIEGYGRIRKRGFKEQKNNDITELHRQLKASVIHIEKNMDDVHFLCSLANRQKHSGIPIDIKFQKFIAKPQSSKIMCKYNYIDRLFSQSVNIYWLGGRNVWVLGTYQIDVLREINKEKIKYFKLILKALKTE